MRVPVFFSVDAPRVDSDDLRAAAEDPDARLLVDHHATFIARVDQPSDARAGAQLELAFNPDQLHLFDPTGGSAIPLSPVSALSGTKRVPDDGKSGANPVRQYTGS